MAASLLHLDEDTLMTLCGELREAWVWAYGVEVDGERYASPELKAIWMKMLRQTPTGRTRKKVRVKIFADDAGYVMVEDPKTLQWVRAPSVLPQIRGITRVVARLARKRARDRYRHSPEHRRHAAAISDSLAEINRLAHGEDEKLRTRAARAQGVHTTAHAHHRAATATTEAGAEAVVARPRSRRRGATQMPPLPAPPRPAPFPASSGFRISQFPAPEASMEVVDNPDL